MDNRSPPVRALSVYERRVLELIPETPHAPILSGDILPQLKVSDTTVYKALKFLERHEAIGGRRVLLPMLIPVHNHPTRKSRNGARWAQAYYRTEHGTALLAAAASPGATPRLPAPRQHVRDDGSLLDDENETAAAITFRVAMQACGLTTLDELRALPVGRRRQFEAIWTQAMYDRCAAAGRPIDLHRVPGTHRHKPDDDDEEDLMD